MDLNSYINVELRTDTTQKADQIERDLNRVKKTGKGAGDEYSRTSDKIAKGSTKAAAGIGRVGDSSNKTQKSLRVLTGGVGGLTNSLLSLAKTPAGGVLAGLALSVGSSIGVFKEFEQSISNLSAITGATGEDLRFYNDEARALGEVTTLSASQVADAFRIVASAKPDLLESKEALAEVTKEAITLAEAAGITVPEAANTMASALNQFNAGAEESARFTNVLAAGSKFGAASIAEMGEALKFGGVVANNFGLSFEQTNAALQLFSTNAIKGGEAGTQLRGVLLALETKMTSEFRPSVVGLEQALINLGEANLSAEEKVKLFGNRNLVAGEILAGNVEKLALLTEQVTGTSIAQEQAEIRTDNLNGAWSRMKSALEELGLVLSQDTGIGFLVTSLIDGLTLLVQAVSFTVSGVIDLTKFVFDLIVPTQLLEETFGSSIGTMSDYVDNLDALKTIVGGELVKAFSVLAQGADLYISVISNYVQTLINTLVSMADSVLELAEVAGPAFDKVFGTETANKLKNMRSSLNEFRGDTRSLGQIIQDNKTKFDKFRQGVDESTESTLSLTLAQADLSDSLEDSAGALTDTRDAAGELNEAFDEVISGLNEEIDALRRTELAQQIYVAQSKAGVDAASEQGIAIRQKVIQIYEEKEALDFLAEAEENSKTRAEELAKASKKAAEDTTDAWLEQRDVLSDFFFEFARDGLSAFDTLLQGFKAMLIKMIAEAAANQIILGVSNGGFSGAASGPAGFFGGGDSGGAGGVFNLGKTAYDIANGGFGTIANAYSTASGYVYSAGGSLELSNALYDTGQFYGGGTLGQNLLNTGIGAVAGIAGSYAGQQVFQNEASTGVGATAGGIVGGVIGTAFGGQTALGTAIGSFIGEGIEAALGNILGFGSGGNNQAIATINGSQDPNARGVGKSFDQKNLDAVEALSSELQAMSALFGSDSLQGKLSVGNKHGIQFKPLGADEGIKFKDVDAFFDYAFDEILKGADDVSDSILSLFNDFDGSSQELFGLAKAITATIGSSAELSDSLLDSAKNFDGTAEELAEFVITWATIDQAISESTSLTPQLEELIRGFEGTNEELLLFTQAVLSLSDQLESNSVINAVVAYAEAQEFASSALLNSYNATVDAVADAVRVYDGSAESTVALNNAVYQSSVAASQLTIGILQLRDSLSAMFESSARSIQEQLLSETELAKVRLEERDRLTALIDELADPQKIEEAARQANILNDQLFNALNQEEKAEFGQEFLDFNLELAQATSDKLDGIIDTARQSQDSLLDSVGTVMNNAADRTFLAAEKLDAAADRILANSRLPQRIEIEVNTTTGDVEVNS